MSEGMQLSKIFKRNKVNNFVDYNTLTENEEGNENSNSRNQSGMLGGIINTTHSILGSGIIGSPYGLKISGFAFGIVFVVIGGLMSSYTLKLMVITGNKVQENTLIGMAGKIYGEIGWWIGFICHFLFTLSIIVTYLIAIGDGLIRIVHRYGGETLAGTPLVDRRFILFVIVVIVLLPLSLYKNIHKFRIWSLTGVFCILFLMIFSLVKFISFGPAYQTTLVLSVIDRQAPKGFSLLVLALVCHQAAFVLWNSLKNKNDKEWNKVVNYSYIISVICILLFSILSYLTFVQLTEGDILNNFCFNDNYATVSRIIFILNLIFVIPIQCFVLREIFNVFLNKYFRKETKTETMKVVEHIIETVVILLTGLGLSLITNCINIVGEISGGIFSVFVGFIFPTIGYIKVSQNRILCKDNIIPLLILILSSAIFIYSAYQIFLEIITGVKCQGDSEIFYCKFNYTNILHKYSNITINPK